MTYKGTGAHRREQFNSTPGKKKTPNLLGEAAKTWLPSLQCRPTFLSLWLQSGHCQEAKPMPCPAGGCGCCLWVQLLESPRQRQRQADSHHDEGPGQVVLPRHGCTTKSTGNSGLEVLAMEPGPQQAWNRWWPLFFLRVSLLRAEKGKSSPFFS